MTIIKTPDQKVRVFISSTINELAEERKVIRDAISSLRLTPVFFEAGARPHPPRDLYSAYLEQSHIFIGIYWNSYGWVAPGQEISGLEDEYRLCGNKPKLIYVKRSNERQPLLLNLLHDIEKSETACYQSFTTAEELRDLVENDLSILMSETFENAMFDKTDKSLIKNIVKPAKVIELPTLKTTLIGRDDDLNELTELLSRKGISLVTILGAGGTGKTTLAIAAAHEIANQFEDGVVFVSLAPLTDAKLVAATIAEILQIQDSGKQAMDEILINYLSDKNILLVLDNFEQIIEAANLISSFINKCPKVKIIVTSRTSLHIRHENIYNLIPLEVPDGEMDKENIRSYPAIALFIERALAVNQRLELDAVGLEAIRKICQRLDGLPLGIELAASRTRFFQPSVLLSRMTKSLDFASKGQKDLPERQQTLKAAIAWSYDLLDEEAKKVFRILGVFKRSWTLEAADAVINSDSSEFLDLEEYTEKLLDVSLIKPTLVSHSSEPRFNMLQTVHEFANELLNESEECNSIKLRFANYFLVLCRESEDQLWGGNGEPWLDKLEYEFQNIRAAFYIFIENKNYNAAWQLFYLLVPYWSIRGGYSEAEEWIRVAGIQLEERPEVTSEINLSVQGKAYLWAGFVKAFLIQIETFLGLVAKAEVIFVTLGDEVNLSYALVMDGSYGFYLSLPDSETKIERATYLAEKTGNVFALIMAYTWTFEYYRLTNRDEIVARNLEKAELLANQYDYKMTQCYIFISKISDLIVQKKYQEIADLSIELYNKLPVKGYKGFKSACWAGYFESMMMLNNLEEAEKVRPGLLQLARESGETESLFHAVLAMAFYYHRMDNLKMACLSFGAIEAFIKATGYPMLGDSLEKYNHLKTSIMQTPSSQIQLWLQEGMKLSLEEIVILES